MSRVYETTMVLVLVAVVVLGIAWVISSLINEDHHSKQQLFGMLGTGQQSIILIIEEIYMALSVPQSALQLNYT